MTNVKDFMLVSFDFSLVMDEQKSSDSTFHRGAVVALDCPVMDVQSGLVEPCLQVNRLEGCTFLNVLNK